MNILQNSYKIYNFILTAARQSGLSVIPKFELSFWTSDTAQYM